MSNRRHFVADAIGCETHEGTLVAGIGSNESGTYVMFQRSATDESDGVWFEFDDQSNGSSDQVTCCSLRDGSLSVDLKPSIDEVDGFDIQLDCEPIEVASLARQLAAIFSKSPEIFITNELL